MKTVDRDEPEPKAIVVAAYEAANQGRYAKANAFLAPEFLKGLTQVGSQALKDNKALRRRLRQLKGRREDAAARHSKAIKKLIQLESADRSLRPWFAA